MKKTILVICLVLALFGQGLFAAGAQEPAKAEAKTTLTKTDPNEKVTLRFAWWGSTPRHQATLKAIELYQSKHPNVTIEAEYGAFKDYYQKLLTQLSGKTAPDIIKAVGPYSVLQPVLPAVLAACQHLEVLTDEHRLDVR